MKFVRLSALLLFTIVILGINLIGFTSCAGNTENGSTVPTFTEPGPPPTEVTVDQLSSDYMSDEAAADAKYKEEKLCFYEVEVEEVFGRDYTDNHGHITFVKEYFMAGPIKFKLRDFGIMQNIEEGYVLNVVGECYGLLQGFVYIEDCWVESVVGDLGTSEWVEIY